MKYLRIVCADLIYIMYILTFSVQHTRVLSIYIFIWKLHDVPNMWYFGEYIINDFEFDLCFIHHLGSQWLWLLELCVSFFDIIKGTICRIWAKFHPHSFKWLSMFGSKVYFILRKLWTTLWYELSLLIEHDK